MVRKISGKSKSANYKHFNTNFNNTEAKATSKKGIADTLGSTFMKTHQTEITVKNSKPTCMINKKLS